jgi:hypothetical protein
VPFIQDVAYFWSMISARTLLTGTFLLLTLTFSGCLLEGAREDRRGYTAEVEMQGLSPDSIPVLGVCILSEAGADTLPSWSSARPEGPGTSSYFFHSRGRQRFQLRITQPDTVLLSEPVSAHSCRNNFVAFMEEGTLQVRSTDHLFPVKESVAGSRLFFLAVFLCLKVLSALLIYSTGRFPWKVFPAFVGAFLFSALLSWHVPITAIALFVLCSWSEGALIFISNRRHISMIRTSLVVTGSNLAAFGLTHMIYSVYYLW